MNGQKFKSKKFKNITTTIAYVILAFDLIVLVSFLLDLVNLNYPLTGVSSSMLFIIIAIILVLYIIIINKYQAGKKCRNLVILMGILIAFDSFYYFLINEIGYIDRGVKKHSLKNISFKVPKSWVSEKKDDIYTFYPYGEGDLSILSVGFIEYDVDEITDEQIKKYYNDYMQTFKENMQKYKKVSEKNIKIDGKNGIKIRYSIKNDNNVNFECESILFFTKEDSTMYIFNNFMEEKYISTLSKRYDKLINTILIDDDKLNEINLDFEETEDTEQENTELPESNIKSSITLSQKNAMKKAKEYLNYSAFSYDGLIEQLEYEQFSHEDSVYAVDNCGADWNEQAVKKAKEYLDYSSFSHGSLVDQLKYEGFTAEQAEYGVSQNGL